MLSLPLLFGMDFLFGSVAAMLAAARLSLMGVALVAALGGVYTVFLWAHPYGLIVFTVEALTVAMLFRRGLRNLVLADMCYWLFLGGPLVYVLYTGALGMPDLAAFLVVLKDMVNGLFNALIAEVLLLAPWWLRKYRGAIDVRRAHLSRHLFTVLVAAVWVVALVPVLYYTQQEKTDFQHRLVESFSREAAILEEKLTAQEEQESGEWQSLLERELRRFAPEGGLALLSPEGDLVASVGEVRESAASPGPLQMLESGLQLWSRSGIANPMKRWQQSRYRFSMPVHDPENDTLRGYFVMEQAAGPFVARQQERVSLQIAFLAIVTVLGSLLAVSLNRSLTAPLDLLARVARKTTNGVLITDTQGRVTWLNEGFQRISGYSLEDLRGRKPGDVLKGPATSPETVQQIEQALRDRQPFNVDLVNYTPEGSSYWVNLRCDPLRDEKGRFEGYIAIETEITDRKLAEQRLLESERVFRNANEAIIIADGSGIVLDVNDAFGRITGCGRDEVLGQTVPQLLPLQEALENLPDTLLGQLEETGRWEGQRRIRCRGGALCSIWQTISVLRDDQGRPSRYICLFNDITPLKEREEDLEQKANHDSLTGLPNRLLLLDRLGQAMAHARRNAQWLAVVYIDLDGFKAVNDVHGHDVGDRLLVAMSARMRHVLRETDTLARLGGDEFVALIGELPDSSELESLLERLRAAIAPAERINGAIAQVTASIGATVYSQFEGVDAARLLKEADHEMYLAKRSGKNRVRIAHRERSAS
ncbi:diguanylate cyclase [Marinobacteraceae bacterium S3BR75-40.1]